MRESESGAVGVGAVAAAAAGNQDVDVFKKPIHPPPRKKKKVLDEETYVKEVEKIIERDFFPDLDGLRDRLDFLEARDSQDLVRLRQWYARQARTVAAASANASVLDSPATFETPQAGAAGNATPRLDDANAQPADDKSTQDPTDKDREKESKGGMSLDEFMSMHTSEDNESFENLMAETEAKFRRKKYLRACSTRFAAMAGYLDLMEVMSDD